MERFWSKVDKTGDCWLWQAATFRNGYGAFSLDGKSQYAHRVSLELDGVDIPSGMDVCHTCDVRNCVNPDHLFIGSRKDNMADMAAKGRSMTGERHPMANLTEDQVRLMRQMKGSHREVADKMGLKHHTVYLVRTGRRWGHIA